MNVVVNNGLRKIIFTDGQARKELVPHQERIVSHEAAMLLAKSFPHEIIVKEIVKDEIAPVKAKKK